MTGTGSDDDPIRPEFVPNSAAKNASTIPQTDTGKAGSAVNTPANPDTPASVNRALATRSGIISWSFQPTDDGKMAIIQVVAVNRQAFQAILAATDTDIRVFEIGKDKPEKIEAEMRKHKRDFSLNSLRTVAR